MACFIKIHKRNEANYKVENDGHTIAAYFCTCHNSTAAVLMQQFVAIGSLEVVWE